MDISGALSHLGHFGLFQTYLFLITSLPVMLAGMIMLSTVFISGTPNHRCLVRECDSSAHPVYQTSFLTFTIPKTDSQCSQYKAILNESLTSSANQCLPTTFTNQIDVCKHGWIYEENEFIETTVSEVSYHLLFQLILLECH
jgi:hypothetical protein